MSRRTMYTRANPFICTNCNQTVIEFFEFVFQKKKCYLGNAVLVFSLLFVKINKNTTLEMFKRQNDSTLERRRNKIANVPALIVIRLKTNGTYFMIPLTETL